MKITIDKVSSILSGLGVSTICPQCSHDNALIPSFKVDGIEYAECFDMRGALHEGTNFTTVAIVCGNCGNARHFLTQMIEKKMPEDYNNG